MTITLPLLVYKVNDTFREKKHTLVTFFYRVDKSNNYLWIILRLLLPGLLHAIINIYTFENYAILLAL